MQDYKKPKISVVVPIYNAEKYIERCINSLVKQTINDMEIILVNDGSTDESGKICDEFSKKDDRIIVIHKKNEGVSAARNFGMSIATGKYIIFADSDDWIPEDAYYKLYVSAEKHHADIVIGDIYKVFDNKKEMVNFYNKPFIVTDRDFIDKMVQADFYRNYCPAPAPSGIAFGYGGPWNKLVRKEIIIQNHINFDVRTKGIFDDIIYTAYILMCAKTILYIQEPVYYYRIIDNSLTRSYKIDALQINNAIFSAWEEFIDKYGEKGQFDKPYAASIIRRLAETLPIYFFNKENKNSLINKLSELKKVICSEPYANAAKMVELSKLSVYHMLIAKLVCKKSVYGIGLLFYIKENVKRAIQWVKNLAS